ncbi:MAG: TrbC/VirB2 family protein [Alphaproteobacteria bacterium]|nr:TrbC/VirB2 family protein [Alphaproteobacteria bacterium]
MKRLFSILAFALFAGVLLWSGNAFADDPANVGDAWQVAFGKVTDAFQNARKMIFIVGGFGLIVLAFWAIFGKLHWKWFAALCVGLGIVAIAGLIIDYVTTEA